MLALQRRSFAKYSCTTKCAVRNSGLSTRAKQPNRNLEFDSNFAFTEISCAALEKASKIGFFKNQDGFFHQAVHIDDIRLWQPEEIRDCLKFLGSLKTDLIMKQQLWELVRDKGEVSE